ncbi:hypothetical protein ACFWF7_37830 [Nocardia sp. NPDC060256]|uniref:hypothetical protein n=1 Tax=unclassified Nocardia TaxID=2637762 RepID=UPI00364E7399
MSDEQATPNAKGPAPVTVPAQEAEPIAATLALEYRDGAPAVVVTGGNTIPSHLAVVDKDGQVVAFYSAQASRMFHPEEISAMVLGR